MEPQSPRRAPSRMPTGMPGRPRWLVALALIGALGVPSSALAQRAVPDLPTDTTLRQLIEESLGARPELRQAIASVRVSREQVAQAGALPDPMVQVGVQNDGFTSTEIGTMDSSYVSIMASQTFPWPGKLDLKRNNASLAVAQAEELVARARLSTEADVRRAYLDVLLVRDKKALLAELEKVWESSLGAARIAYATGTGTQADVVRAELELSRLRLRRLSLQAEERARIQNINRLRGHPLDEPIAVVGTLADLPAPSTLDGQFSVERALAQSPELAAARIGVARSETMLALADKGYYPDLTVGAGVMVRGALPPMWLVTVGAPVPLFAEDKQERALAEGRAQTEVASLGVTGLEQVIRLRSQERHTAFSALLQTLDLYEQGLLVLSETTYHSTLAQYRVGKVTFASVLEANKGYIADREGYLEALAEAHRILIAEAEVNLSSVTMPSAAASTTAAAPSEPAAMGGSSPAM